MDGQRVGGEVMEEEQVIWVEVSDEERDPKQ